MTHRPHCASPCQPAASRSGWNCPIGMELTLSASIELISSSARVTSAKFHKVPYVGTDIERPGPIDRTPETPGSGKKNMGEKIFQCFLPRAWIESVKDSN